MRSLTPLTILLLTAACSAAIDAGAPVSEKPDPVGIEFFEKHIRPVLAEKCYGCHSTEKGKSKGGLLLDTREGIRAGGDTGHAVVPGNVGESVLLKRLRATDKDELMPPPKEGGPLAPEIVARFEQWIKMGAPDPRENSGPKPVAKKIDVEAGRKFWAFQQVTPVEPPKVTDAQWPRGDVDRFLLAAMEVAKIKPAVDAEKAPMLRRVFFDLVGLPPAPEDIDAFLKDHSPDALAKVVDRLLATREFGERWGRHWLDVARYGESTGRERNFTFPEAWRYRDWVIAAFTEDKPYDQFIREQIAGDLLPNSSPQQRDRQIVATGFLALGPKGLNEKNKAQFAADVVDEQIDVATRAILGTSVACARCHDHKFDPISQKDYYAMAGIFRSTETYYGTAGPRNRNATELIPLSTPSLVTAAKDEIEVEEGAEGTTFTPAQRQRILKRAEAKNPKLAARMRTMPPEQFARATERLREKLGNAGNKKKGYAEVKPSDPATPACMGVLEGKPSNARILIRGEIDQPGDIVPRGFAEVLTLGQAPGIPASQSGRAQLADWLVQNPLAARVMVNRVWLHLFGDGLVRTPDNFGFNGEKPTNASLLDTLAAKFRTPAAEGGMGWSVKRLIRELVLTRAYGLSSAHDSYAVEVDPDNRLHWRQESRRLDAESIRDAMLAASGQLDSKPGEGSLVSAIGNAYVGKQVKPETFTNYESRKRSVYLPIVRDNVPEVLDLFDFAEPSLVIASRESTNVPSQALFMMNNGFVREQAMAMAKRVLGTPIGFPERVNLAHLLALGRPATAAEQTRAHRYLLAEATDLIPSKGNQAAAAEMSWATFCQALFASAEFRYLR
jgi:hypothetical protein